MPNFSIEEEINSPVIGLDEVGRGPLAGPVISCGCHFKNYTLLHELKDFIGDSKKLSAKKRELSFKFLQNLKKGNIIDFHLGIANVHEIDNLNILEATKLSMKRVIDKFNLKNAQLIIDGNFSLNYKSYKEQSIIKGDNKSLSIAAASIIAKVHRDRLMKKLSIKFKDFGWEKNAGYGTKMHIENIHRFGPTIHHRKTFEPIKSLIHN
ncbi:MAG: ribonuclease HII [Alphaproteobacteria bacterium]